MIISLSFPQKYQKNPISGQNPDIFHRFRPRINTISTQLIQTILSIQQIHSVGLDVFVNLTVFLMPALPTNQNYTTDAFPLL
jgi:hypothetical protein